MKSIAQRRESALERYRLEYAQQHPHAMLTQVSGGEDEIDWVLNGHARVNALNELQIVIRYMIKTFVIGIKLELFKD